MSVSCCLPTDLPMSPENHIDDIYLLIDLLRACWTSVHVHRRSNLGASMRDENAIFCPRRAGV